MSPIGNQNLLDHQQKHSEIRCDEEGHGKSLGGDRNGTDNIQAGVHLLETVNHYSVGLVHDWVFGALKFVVVDKNSGGEGKFFLKAAGWREGDEVVDDDGGEEDAEEDEVEHGARVHESERVNSRIQG